MAKKNNDFRITQGTSALLFNRDELPVPFAWNTNYCDPGCRLYYDQKDNEPENRETGTGDLLFL